LPEVLIGCFQIAYPDPVLKDPGAPPKTSTETCLISNSSAPNNSEITTNSSITSSMSATQNSNPTHLTLITAPLKPTNPAQERQMDDKGDKECRKETAQKPETNQKIMTCREYYKQKLHS